MIPASIHTICICGAGTMGSGIALLFAQNGFPVTIYDVDAHTLNKAAAEIRKQLVLLKEKGKLSDEKTEQIFSAIHFTKALRNCRADLVIEAIIEDLSAKIKLFRELSSINENQPCIFTTNTSSLPVSVIGESLKDPSAFAGMHFFNPAPVMKLIELVKGKDTGDPVISTLATLVTRLGKTAVICKDIPGFIVNRVARPYYLEALYLAEQYGITFENIDGIMENAGFRMGPFRLMDMIGNDINLAVSVSLYEALGKPARLQPSSIQQEKVRLAALGKKTGRGYYDY